MTMGRMVLSVYFVLIYWLAEALKALHEPEAGEYEPTVLSRWDRLTPDEHWQLDNFGIIRKDFMGWFIDGIVTKLVETPLDKPSSGC